MAKQVKDDNMDMQNAVKWFRKAGGQGQGDALQSLN